MLDKNYNKILVTNSMLSEFMFKSQITESRFFCTCFLRFISTLKILDFEEDNEQLHLFLTFFKRLDKTSSGRPYFILSKKTILFTENESRVSFTDFVLILKTVCKENCSLNLFTHPTIQYIREFFFWIFFQVLLYYL